VIDTPGYDLRFSKNVLIRQKCLPALVFLYQDIVFCDVDKLLRLFESSGLSENLFSHAFLKFSPYDGARVTGRILFCRAIFYTGCSRLKWGTTHRFVLNTMLENCMEGMV